MLIERMEDGIVYGYDQYGRYFSQAVERVLAGDLYTYQYIGERRILWEPKVQRRRDSGGQRWAQP